MVAPIAGHLRSSVWSPVNDKSTEVGMGPTSSSLIRRFDFEQSRIELKRKEFEIRSAHGSFNGNGYPLSVHQPFKPVAHISLQEASIGRAMTTNGGYS